MNIGTDEILHIAEIVVIGAPLWYGVLKLYVIHKEFPPHIHENGSIRYPRGMEPGKVFKMGGNGQ